MEVRPRVIFTPWVLMPALAAGAVLLGALLALLAVEWVSPGALASWLQGYFFYDAVSERYDGSVLLVYHDYAPNVSLMVLCIALAAVSVIALCCAVGALVCRRAARVAYEEGRGAAGRDAARAAELFFSRDVSEDEAFPAHLAALARVAGRERAARERERAATRAETERKDDLVAYLAHDLKTPLTSVIGYADMLAEDPDMPRERRVRYAAAVRDKGMRLEGLVNEFFEIARYNLQSIELAIGRVDLGLLFEQLAEELYPLAAAHGNELSVDVGRGTVVAGDADKLARAFGNVLRNAVAYSYEATPVRVEAEATGSQVVVRIANVGPTIPARQLASIFERFYRIDGARGSASGGAGLGLAIAREVVERHGGTITAESAREQTVFTIALPAYPGGTAGSGDASGDAASTAPDAVVPAAPDASAPTLHQSLMRA